MFLSSETLILLKSTDIIFVPFYYPCSCCWNVRQNEACGTYVLRHRRAAARAVQRRAFEHASPEHHHRLTCRRPRRVNARRAGEKGPLKAVAIGASRDTFHYFYVPLLPPRAGSSIPSPCRRRRQRRNPRSVRRPNNPCDPRAKSASMRPTMAIGGGRG